MNKISILLILSLLQYCNAQEKGQRIYSSQIREISFLKYPSNLQIKAILNSQNEAKCVYPEDLMLSIMSCSDSDWEIYHTIGGKENADVKADRHYLQIKIMNKEKNYFELKHKFEFLIANVPTAIVKFYLITEQIPTPVAGVVTMQKYDGRWQKCSMRMFSKLAMLALRIKSSELEKIIEGSEENKYLKELQSKIKINGNIDFDRLAAETDSWHIDNSKKNQDIKTYFKDPNSPF